MSNKKLLLFSTEWCGYSQRFFPVWEQLRKVAPVQMIKIDCDKEKSIAKSFGIQGYPTIKLVVGKKIVDYNGNRDVNSILNFVKNTN